jgi:hypothetical protein
VENKKERPVVTAGNDGDRRTKRLVEGLSIVESFAGWGPSMIGSARNILRGLN